MAFHRATNTSIRESTFNDVGRDQVTVHHAPICQINISFFGSGAQTPRVEHHPRFYSRTLRTSADEAPSQNTALTKGHHSFDASLMVDTAVGLIVRITHLLVDHRNLSDCHRDLELELKSSQQILILAELAIQEYRGRPLAQSLACTVTPAMFQCCLVLQELFETVTGTQIDLTSTNISGLWSQVWRRRWDGDELASLRQKLSVSRKSLAGFLLALHSVAWMEIGNELRKGQVSLDSFHKLFSQRLPFLGHIKLNTVQVLNHLGDIIAVPDMFCFTWKDFHYIIDGHCKNRPGGHFIERGDYEVLRDGQTIKPSELASNAQPGAILEMSIILRTTSALQKQCPRCGYLNSDDVVANSGWVECRSCPGLFQVAEKVDEDDLKGDESNNNENDEHEGDDEHSGEESGMSEGNNRDSVEEVTSPASANSSGTDHLKDGDGTQYFRRIHIISLLVGINNRPHGSLQNFELDAAATIRNERGYRLYLMHEFHPSLMLPLWIPSPIALGAVGYLDKSSGIFVTLFNSFDPAKSSNGAIDLPSLHEYGQVNQGEQRRDTRNAAQRGLDALAGLLTSKTNSQNVNRRYSFPLRDGHRVAYMCTESTKYQYIEELQTPKKWFKSNADRIIQVYGPQYHIHKEELYLVTGTLSAPYYGLFVSHKHFDGQVHFNVFSSPRASQDWGTFTIDSELLSEINSPYYPVPGNHTSAQNVSPIGGANHWDTLLLARLRFKPGNTEPTSL